MAKPKVKNILLSLPLAILALLIAGAGIYLVSSTLGRLKITPRASSGNNAPSGSHFNLNIIGVPKDKTADISGGNRIFVPLTGSCQIKLSEGTYQVLDANCTDGSGTFQLPNPDPTNTGVTTYSVWARALGKPGGKSSTTTCATDPTDQMLYCSIYSMVQVRNKGKSSFTNVSKELLYVYADINGDGTNERMPLFDSRLQDYYWQYDNQGLKMVQLRFYEISTTVP
ncbi:hypothetical protein A2W13_00160 [Candidatus Woesebacteria bacterium RBG_16_36_11]|uniref:Uncharacterized protein n=2 Tax=Candidatus Woeseibacteriota TaxID=1752722 RepID=A0A1F7X717_9BACT|nr:MAG: hypothetical protein A2W13_00160 [Candidatus Woesebacteria bacterium RBG_16_36_11]OGM17038.1 MAG: hypothetical protein A2V55_02235 [Candidatus Woesebacteria bacterium RBG_19FT_COMBO_37_29]